MSTKMEEIGVDVNPDVTEQMAQDMFVNAIDYLEGRRECTRAFFVYDSPIHAQAAERFAELLGKTDYAEDLDVLGDTDHQWTDTARNVSYNSRLTQSIAARAGKRILFMSTMLETVANGEAVTRHVQYSSELVEPQERHFTI